MLKRIKSEPQWAFNFLLTILIMIIGYSAMRMDTRIDLKADTLRVDEMCIMMRQKVDKSYLDRVDSGLQTQIARLAKSIDRLNLSIERRNPI